MSFGIIMWNKNLEKKQILCYMDTDRFIVHIKTEGIYVDIAWDKIRYFKFWISKKIM